MIEMGLLVMRLMTNMTMIHCPKKSNKAEGSTMYVIMFIKSQVVLKDTNKLLFTL